MRHLAAPHRKKPPRLRAAYEKRAYARRVGGWLSWFATLLCAQLYDGVPAVRSFLALDLYATLVETWSVA